MRFTFPVQDSAFKKSSRSTRFFCVNVAMRPEGVAVRNSKDETKVTAFFTNEEWDAFIAGAKDGEFDVKK